MASLQLSLSGRTHEGSWTLPLRSEARGRWDWPRGQVLSGEELKEMV